MIEGLTLSLLFVKSNETAGLLIMPVNFRIGVRESTSVVF